MLTLLVLSRKMQAVCPNEKSIATNPQVTIQHSLAQADQPHMPKHSWVKEWAQICSAGDSHGSVVVVDEDVNPSMLTHCGH